jgi:hypothetical protein
MAKSDESQIFYGHAISRAYDDVTKSIAFSSSYAYKNITSATNQVISTTAGILHAIVLNTAAAGSIIIYDGNHTTGTIIGTIKASAGEGTYLYDVVFKTGLEITTGHADLDVTVVYSPESAIVYSASASPSASESPSASVSPSKSASSSVSPSSSASSSNSPSSSLSPSASMSKSVSPSSSESKSISPSVSNSGSGSN